MRKKIINFSILLILLSVANCKSLISVAEGQTKGKTYATVVAPGGFFEPARFYVSQCVHEGNKFTCSGEVSVTLK